MEEIRQYVFSVSATTVICGILSSLLNGHHVQPIVRFLLGLILVSVVLRPLSAFDPESVNEWSNSFSQAAQIHTSAGERMGNDALRQCITEELQSYILTKAEELDMDLRTEIILNPEDPPVPIAVKLYGEPAPDVRLRLQEFLESELGIAKEYQEWIGPN